MNVVHRSLVGAERGSSASERIFIPPVSVEERVHRDLHLLLWQVRGDGEYVLDGARRQMSAGHALWVPANTRHQMTVRMNSVVLRFFFAVEELATVQNEPTMIAVDEDLRILLLAHAQWESSLLQGDLNLSRQILALIEAQPVRSTALPMPKTLPALSVAENLRFNPGDERSVEELAQAAHTSVRTLERTFPSETGMTLRQWRITNRMEVAGNLLRGETHIAAVAQRVGYNNASAFGRAFKTHFGMTPGEYVNRFRSRG